MNEDDRIEGLAQLARRQKPDRDLWPGIQARLRPRRSRWPAVQFALAASLVAGLAGIFGRQMARAPQGTPATEVAMADRTPLRHDSRAIVKANLAIVSQAEQQLRQALAKNPDSSGLRELLASTENRGRSLRALL